MKEVYKMGATAKLVVVINDAGTGNKVDPGTLLFLARFPPSNELKSYLYNGVSWANDENSIFVPSRESSGIYKAVINVPVELSAVGRWRVGWVSTANGSGQGRGSGELFFDVIPLEVYQ